MSRLGAFLTEARAGLGQYDMIPEADLAAIGRRCGAAEIGEAIDRIERLETEKAALPAWDGDTHDALAEGQLTLVKILRAVNPAEVGAVEAGLQRRDPPVRTWIALALEGQPDAGPALAAALQRETDANARAAIEGVITRRAAASRRARARPSILGIGVLVLAMIAFVFEEFFASE